VRIQIDLAVSRGAPARARAVLADVLVDALPPERVQDGQLLISELVTNSVLHAGLSETDSIDVLVIVDDDAVRVAVTDRGSGFAVGDELDPSKRPADVWESGRGLSLVELLADRWGTDRGASGEVWFEIDRQAPGLL
jgi:anti-sigma regulatory factor (Ser/Thr protein kinase)